MISEILNDISKKPKEKTALLSSAVLDGTISVDTLLAFAATAKDSPKATCIEALEFATQQKPELADKACLLYTSRCV